TLWYSGLLCFFFFFQAEDGIRDWSVTGVQTCALPICIDAPALVARKELRQRAVPSCRDDREIMLSRDLIELTDRNGTDLDASPRSEERRVGKEWRYRGWRYR